MLISKQNITWLCVYLLCNPETYRAFIKKEIPCFSNSYTLELSLQCRGLAYGFSL